jgi:hypothetical protein
MVPGVVAIYHGGFYEPAAEKTALMPDGIDMGGAMNFLTEDDQPGKLVIGPTVGSGPVQVELFAPNPCVLTESCTTAAAVSTATTTATSGSTT